jgi:hypothetical protein
VTEAKRGRPRKERYARLMGGCWRNPKVRRLSLEARGVLLMAWSYAADQATDGAVPLEMIEAWARGRYRKLLAELTGGERPFLTVADGAIDAMARDWTEHNIAVSEWETKLASDRKRKRNRGDFPTGNPPDIPTGNPGGNPTGIPPTFQHGALDEDEDEDEDCSQRTPDPSETSAAEPEPPVRGKPRVPAADVRGVFEHWRAKLGKSAAAKLDRKREARIRWALDAYGAESVRRCIDGYAASPWHLGQNDRGQRYDDLTLWLRDAEHVERGIAMAEQGPRLVGRLPPSRFSAEDAQRSMADFDALVGPEGVANG